MFSLPFSLTVTLGDMTEKLIGSFLLVASLNFVFFIIIESSLYLNSQQNHL
jgi:hypothetical protein